MKSLKCMMLSCFCFVLSCGDVVSSTQKDGGGVNDATAADAGVGVDCSASEIAVEDLYTCFVRATCIINQRCGLSYGTSQFVFDSIDECVNNGGFASAFPLIDTFIKNVQIAVQLDEQNGEETMVYDGAAASQCIDLANTATCKTNPFVGPPQCRQIAHSNEDRDDSCNYDFQCSAASYCEIPSDCDANQCCSGACTRFAKESESCGDPLEPQDGEGATWRCEPGLRCVRKGPIDLNNGSIVDWVCQDGGVDTECHRHADCQADYFCDKSSFLEPGECVDDLPIGAGCAIDPGVGSRNNACAGDAFCIAGTCVLTDVSNASCRNIRDCRGGQFCFDNRCRPLLNQDDETACNQFPDTCLGSNLFCTDQMTCRPRASLEETCPNSSGCELGLFCTNEIDRESGGRCSAPLPELGICTLDHQCQSGYCEKSDFENQGNCRPWEICS